MRCTMRPSNRNTATTPEMKILSEASTPKPLPWICPNHDNYSVPNWVPEEWKSRVTKCISGNSTWKTMSNEEFADLHRFVITIKNNQNLLKELTWEAVYNLSLSCLKYPNFFDLYNRRYSDEKSELLVNKMVKPRLLSVMQGASEYHYEKILEMYHFMFMWAPTEEHAGLLHDISISSNVPYNLIYEIDLEIRRRMLIEYDGNEETLIKTENGMSYAFFLYQTTTTPPTPNVFYRDRDILTTPENTRGRWMLIGHECNDCYKPHNYNSGYFMSCSICGDAIMCAHCGKAHQRH